MLGVVLLYVGAVLVLNGIWLYGLARAQEEERVAAEGGGAVAAERPVPSYVIESREIAIINVFTGVIGFTVAIVSLVYGLIQDDVPSFAFAGFVLLFAFTYLWVAYNQYTGVSGRGLGWYCLFVAITAVPTGFIVLSEANGEIFGLWLGANWLAWAVLWFLFFLLLALQWPIMRLTGLVAIFQGIATAWAFAYVFLTERIVGL